MWAGPVCRRAKPACLAPTRKATAPPPAPLAHRASSRTPSAPPAARHALQDRIKPEGDPRPVSCAGRASLALNLAPPTPPPASLAPQGRTRPARVSMTLQNAGCARQANSQQAWACRTLLMPAGSVQPARYHPPIEPTALHAGTVHSVRQAPTRPSCAKTTCWRVTAPICWPGQDISRSSKKGARGPSPALKEPDAAQTQLTIMA